MRQNRLDRQIRIEGWNQKALENATVGVVGDNDLLASLYVLSASALGINKLLVLAPELNDILIETAKKLNPRLDLIHIKGFYVHPSLDDILSGCRLTVDLCRYALANKLLLEKGYKKNIPIIRGFCFDDHDDQGFKIFTYMRGREWQELEQILAPHNLPNGQFDDSVLDMIIAGIVLEETKNILMGHDVSDTLVSYKRKKPKRQKNQPEILVVGSGALGTFVGLGLAYSGFQNITFMDPDIVDVTNLNRQIFFYDAVGKKKSQALSKTFNTLFDIESRAAVTYFDRDNDISSFDVVFDCVDNFESRIALSEKCRDQNKILISGGTSEDAGQVVAYHPGICDVTPAKLLGLYDVVEKRKSDHHRQQRESCTDQADPSVIMTNQIAAGFMVDSYRILLDGQHPENIFYNSKSNTRF